MGASADRTESGTHGWHTMKKACEQDSQALKNNSYEFSSVQRKWLIYLKTRTGM